MLRKFRKMMKNEKGFTLVEVIVVAVIVAVLAAVAIPLYLGYIESSKVNMANNTASSAATYLGAARNSSAAGPFASLAAGGTWTYTPTGAATAVVWTCPSKTAITVTGTITAGGTVTCTYDGRSSTGTYNY
jgi:type IV pilus assembly protein PilA